MANGFRFLIAAATVFVSGFATAQTWPSRTIKFIVPFPAGGPSDTLARILGEKLGAQLGQPVIVENRAGAGGVTGVAIVAKAEPDGYTIGLASSGTLAINVALQEKMPYDPRKDLTLVTQAVSAPELLVVGTGVPAKSLAEFIDLAKKQPGKLTFASTGVGGMPHLAGELLKLAAGIDIVHLPYAGAAPAVNDLMGGHVQALFADVPILLGAVQSGQLRALAVGGKSRVPVLPDVATTAELGMPRIEADNWYGVIAPANLPAEVSRKLFEQVTTALRSQDVKDRLEKQGFGVVANTSGEFAAYVQRETDRWAQVITEGKISIK